MTPRATLNYRRVLHWPAHCLPIGLSHTRHRTTHLPRFQFQHFLFVPPTGGKLFAVEGSGVVPVHLATTGEKDRYGGRWTDWRGICLSTFEGPRCMTIKHLTPSSNRCTTAGFSGSTETPRCLTPAQPPSPLHYLPAWKRVRVVRQA